MKDASLNAGIRNFIQWKAEVIFSYGVIAFYEAHYIVRCSLNSEADCGNSANENSLLLDLISSFRVCWKLVGDNFAAMAVGSSWPAPENYELLVLVRECVWKCVCVCVCVSERERERESESEREREKEREKGWWRKSECMKQLKPEKKKPFRCRSAFSFFLSIRFGKKRFGFVSGLDLELRRRKRKTLFSKLSEIWAETIRRSSTHTYFYRCRCSWKTYDYWCLQEWYCKG